MPFDITGRSCTVCGRPPTGTISVSLHGEITCVRHPVRALCVFCGRPDPEPQPPGWRTFAPGLRCTTCGADVVETQAEARRLLPGIRREMADIGITLPTRVLVRLVPCDQLDPGRQPIAGALLLGVTEHIPRGAGRRAEVVEIRIARGQPLLQFGRAVAHEMGHAWLTQHGAVRPDPAIEEGLCELFAHGWLKRRDGPTAEELRRRLRENPDPVYGVGFRTVRDAATRHGVSAVLTSLARTGSLPD
jgi:hypothetical protein